MILRLIALLAFAGPCQGQDQALVRRAVVRLLAQPTAIPVGTRLVGLRARRSVIGPGVVVVLSSAFAHVVDPGAETERAIELVAKTVIASSRYSSVFIEVRCRDGRTVPLDALLPRPRPVARGTGGKQPGPSSVRGALSGRTIAVSPGHGYYWNASLGWTTQRPSIGGLTEDFHTAEIANRYLIPYLENMGASVFSCRDGGEITHERIGDNDQGGSVYKETGVWSTSNFNGYRGRTYRFATTSATSSARATWTLRVPASGLYPVQAFFRAGANRTLAARYDVHHAGGVSEVFVDQTRDDRTWVSLGSFWFDAGHDARVVLDNRNTQTGRVVIADAIRIGAGMGSIVRGSRTSGQPRWRECSRYWAEYAGAPATVWNSSSTDHNDDVTCRPRFAEWRGADAYVSLHTNAGGGSGTSSFIHSTSPTRGSAQLQAAVQAQIVGDIRRYYDSTWIDRGRKSANFGEVRLLSTMPGVLVELAFHDVDRSRDHNALHDPKFRRIAARGYARGVLRYFNPTAAFPPERPERLRVTQDGSAGLRVAWASVPGASFYSIEQSPGGKAFVEVAQTQSTAWSTGPLPHGAMLSFRVRAWNASGRSFPSEVLTAGTSHDRQAECLLVAGFDRLGKFVKTPENTRDYLRLHGDAIHRSAEFSLGFDAACNEVVADGTVPLARYRAVVWALGEESTADDTFDFAEQARVRAYLARGGRLLVTGAEIGWDLVARGSASDRAFYETVLGARYVRDDAGVYTFRGAASGIFKGLAAGRFDDGSGPTYDVDFPDVLAPFDATSSVCLRYGNGMVAGIQRVAGQSRVVNLGFPLETIVDANLRADLMRRGLRFLLTPRSLDLDSNLAPGGRTAVRVTLPSEAGRIYVLAAAAHHSPGLALPHGTLPLNPDPLFASSLGATNGVFQRFAGLLDGQGRAAAEVRIPNDARLRGLRFVVSGLTLLPSPPYFGTLLPWYGVSVR